jgi:hypothetical protein
MAMILRLLHSPEFWTGVSVGVAATLLLVLVGYGVVANIIFPKDL